MKYILQILTLSSLIVFSGCASDPASVNANVGSIEVQKQNENINTVGTALELSETTTDTEIDTSDWQIYTNEKIGLKFEYPLPSSQMRFDFTDCSQVKCDSESGRSYSLSFIDQDDKHGYAVAGASTLDFAAGRDMAFYDVAFYKNQNSIYEAVLTEESSFEIKPISTQSYLLGSVVIYKAQDLPSYPQLIDAQIERKDDKLCIYNFIEPIAGFQSISFLFTPEMTDQDINRVLNSVEKI